jgi:hypothetical protein
MLTDPDQLEAIAVRYEQAADEVAGTGRRSARRVDASSWSCARADRCRQAAFDAGVRAEQAAADMRSLAGDLRFLAAQRRAEIEQALLAEVRVRAYWAESGTGFGAWPVTETPSSGDPAWIGVARSLGLE